MNHDSVDLVLFDTGNKAAAHGPGGAVWDDDESHLFVVLPGHRCLDAIATTRDQTTAQNAARVWLVTGTRECPTLHPSLHVPGQWHGWLREGQLVSC